MHIDFRDIPNGLPLYESRTVYYVNQVKNGKGASMNAVQNAQKSIKNHIIT